MGHLDLQFWHDCSFYVHFANKVTKLHENVYELKPP